MLKKIPVLVDAPPLIQLFRVSRSCGIHFAANNGKLHVPLLAGLLADMQ